MGRPIPLPSSLPGDGAQLAPPDDSVEGDAEQVQGARSPARQPLVSTLLPFPVGMQPPRARHSGIQTNILFIKLHMNFPLVREVDWQCGRYHRNLTDRE